MAFGRLFKRILLIGLVVVVAAAVAAVILLPREIESRAIAALADAGFKDAEIGSVRVGLGTVSLHDVRLDEDGRARIETLLAVMSLDGARAGRAELVRIDGARIAMAASPAGLEFPGLSAGPGTRPDAESTLPEGIFDFDLPPIDSIIVNDVEVTVASPAGPITMTGDGRFALPDADRLDGDGRLQVDGDHGRLDLRFTAVRDADRQLRGEVRVLSGNIGVPGGSAVIRGGQATVTLRADDTRPELGGVLNLSDAMVAGVPLDRVDLTVFSLGSLIQVVATSSSDDAGLSFEAGATVGRDVGGGLSVTSSTRLSVSDARAAREFVEAHSGATLPEMDGTLDARLHLTGFWDDAAFARDPASMEPLTGRFALDLSGLAVPGTLRAGSGDLSGRLEFGRESVTIAVDPGSFLRGELWPSLAAGMPAPFDRGGLVLRPGREDGLRLSLDGLLSSPMATASGSVSAGSGVAEPDAGSLSIDLHDVRVPFGATDLAAGFDGTIGVSGRSLVVADQSIGFDLSLSEIALVDAGSDPEDEGNYPSDPLLAMLASGRFWLDAGTGNAAAESLDDAARSTSSFEADIILGSERFTFSPRNCISVDLPEVNLGAEGRLAFPQGLCLRSTSEDSALVEATLDDQPSSAMDDREWRVRLDGIVAARPFVLTLPAADGGPATVMTGTLPGGPVRFDSADSGGGAFDYRGSGGRVSVSPQNVSATGVSIRLDYRPGEALPLELALSAARMGDGGSPAWMAPVRADIFARGHPEQIIYFSTRLRGIDGPTDIRIEGRHSLASGAGRADLAVDAADLAGGGAGIGLISPRLGQWASETSGSVAGTFALAWGSTGFDGTGEVLLDDVTGRIGGLGVSGLNGVLTFDGLNPVSLSDRQVVSMALLDVGIPLTEGEVEFRFLPDSIIDVSRAEWRWAGGLVRALPFEARLGETRQLTVLEAENLDLFQVLDRIGVDGLEATGQLSGRIPIELVDGAVQVRDGTLSANAPGTIRYAPDEVPAALRTGEGSAPDMLVEALQNFRYDDLRMTINGEAGGEQSVAFSIEGHNPDFYGGYPVDLSLNVSGALDTIFRHGMSAYTIPEQVRERMMDFEGQLR